MSSCTFEELISRVATMLRDGSPWSEIDQLLKMLSPDYRAEVLASAQDLVKASRTSR
jgi:hypothetical protein